jgi:dihydroflavonol-4-reductase
MILDLAKRTWLPIPLGGNNFVDVAVVVEAMIAAARRGNSGETYILGNANLSYEQIFSCIASILGRKHYVIHLAPSTWERISGSLAAWEKATGKEGRLNSILIQLGNVNHYYDSSRAIQQLGMPQHPVELAIERAVKWFKETGKV